MVTMRCYASFNFVEIPCLTTNDRQPPAPWLVAGYYSKNVGGFDGVVEFWLGFEGHSPGRLRNRYVINIRKET